MKAYTSNALVALAMQAPKVIPDHFLGLTTIPAGELWKGIGVPIGIFLWLVVSGLLCQCFYHLTLSSGLLVLLHGNRLGAFGNSKDAFHPQLLGLHLS